MRSLARALAVRIHKIGWLIENESLSVTRYTLSYLPVSGKFCRLMLIFANSFEPDQARQNIGPDLDIMDHPDLTV